MSKEFEVEWSKKFSQYLNGENSLCNWNIETKTDLNYIKNNPETPFSIGINSYYLKKEILNELHTLENIIEVRISNIYQEAEMPNILGEFLSIYSLKISHTDFEILPNNFRKLKKLKLISIYDTPLIGLPKEIEFLENLKHVEIFSRARIHEIPKCLEKLNQLEYLYINSTDLTDISFSDNSFQKLKELVLERNKISRIPENLCRLKNLETLSLSNNIIQTIEWDMTNLLILKQLKLLALNRNQLSEFQKRHLKEIFENSQVELIL